MTLIDFIIDNSPIAWVIAAIILAIIEAATMGLTTIWFAIGAVCAALVAVFGGSALLQLVVFFLISILTMIFTRPVAIKKLKIGKEKNVIDDMEGKIGLVIETIEPFKGGRVHFNSLDWAAVGRNPDMRIEKGEEVRVVKVEGVKIIVELAETDI